jgi:hypothetical protein
MDSLQFFQCIWRSKHPGFTYRYAFKSSSSLPFMKQWTAHRYAFVLARPVLQLQLNKAQPITTLLSARSVYSYQYQRKVFIVQGQCSIEDKSKKINLLPAKNRLKTGMLHRPMNILTSRRKHRSQPEANAFIYPWQHVPAGDWGIWFI